MANHAKGSQRRTRSRAFFTGRAHVPREARRLSIPALLAFAAALLLGGCGGNSGNATHGSEASSGPKQHGGTLNVAQAEETIDLDPGTLFAPPDINVDSQINEPLFKEDFQGKLVPWLVEKYETSDNQRVWTLQLRPGVKFSNGKPLTSADVVFSLERVKENPSWASFTEGMAKIAATAPLTVVITNKEPAAELSAILALYPFNITPTGLAGESAKEFSQHPIGTGPFMLKSWKHGESLTLVRNPRYWQKGKPYLDEIVFQTVSDPNSRTSQLRGGQLDVIQGPPWSQVESLEDSSETDFGDFPRAFVEEIWLNAKNPLFANQKVREAVSLALDREGMNQAVLLGRGEPAIAIIPKALPFHDASLPVPEQDIAKATELLEEAEKEGAPSPSFTMIVPNEDDFWVPASQIVQQNLNEVGFDVTLKKVETASGLEMVQTGNYEASFGGAFAEMPSPAETFAFYNGFNGFFTNAPTDETSKVFGEALSAVDKSKRKQLYFRLQEIIAEEGYVVNVLYKPYSWAFRSDVEGFYVGVSSIPYFAETSLTS